MDFFAKAVKNGMAKGYAIGQQQLQQHLAKQRDNNVQYGRDETSGYYGAQPSSSNNTASYSVKVNSSRDNIEEPTLLIISTLTSLHLNSNTSNTNINININNNMPRRIRTTERRHHCLPDSTRHLSRSQTMLYSKHHQTCQRIPKI